jgi:hypothetical protein
MDFNFILGFVGLLTGFGNAVLGFMTYEISILGVILTPLEMVGGAGLVIIVVALLVKAITPLL